MYGTFIGERGEVQVLDANDEGQYTTYAPEEEGEGGSDDEKEVCHNDPYNVILARNSSGNFGIKIKRNAAGEVYISGIIDQNLSALWDVRVGDVLCQINGVEIAGSLETAAKLCKSSKDIADVQLIRRGAPDLETAADLSGSTRNLQNWRVRRYKVRPFENIQKIAERHCTTIEQIRNDNRHYFPRGEPSSVFPGQLLVVRDCRGGKRHVETESKHISHIVADSDTLADICHYYGVQAADVRADNRSVFPIGFHGDVVPGQRLNINVRKQIMVIEKDEKK
mmetsp:Transcript_22703/g.32928  ORF Transcript_22703/g.32928 Transcript_22703/m.32928 type:complete len:280 (-) Transcript_22703:90-929(-)